MKAGKKWVAIAAACLAIGCRQGKSTDQVPKTDTKVNTKVGKMMFGKLEITAALDHLAATDTSQESVLLRYRLENHGDSTLPAPLIAAHRATWTLKDLASGQVKTLAFEPQPHPGTPRFQEDPEFGLEPGKVWEFTLAVPDYLGNIPAGKYSLKYRLESAKHPFETGWMDFQADSTLISKPDLPMVKDNQ